MLLGYMDDLQKIYNEKNYPSKTRMYRLQRDIYDLKYTKKQVDEFVESQEVYQLTKEVKRQPVYNSVVAPEVGSNYMIDLIIYDRFEIHKYKYILNCIDIKSRYAYGIALTRKTTDVVIGAMKKIFRKMGHVCNELQMDKGTEFTSHKFQDEMKKLGVKKFFYSDVGDIHKQSIIERHNKTLAMLLRYWREGSGEKTWYKVLDDMYNLYNNSVHRTIKNKPIDVWKGVADNEQAMTRVLDTFKIGDIVRKRIHKKVFDKGDTIQYSRDTYTIMKKDGNKYILSANNDKNTVLKGRYSSDELLHAKKNISTPVPDKKKSPDKQGNDNRVKKKVQKTVNSLATVGDSKFMHDVKNIKGKRRAR